MSTSCNVSKNIVGSLWAHSKGEKHLYNKTKKSMNDISWMKGNQFNICIFMPPTGNQSSNVENKKIERNLLMKLNRNVSLTWTELKIENG